MIVHRFCLSLREVEDLLAERGIIVDDETVRHIRATGFVNLSDLGRIRAPQNASKSLIVSSC